MPVLNPNVPRRYGQQKPLAALQTEGTDRTALWISTILSPSPALRGLQPAATAANAATDSAEMRSAKNRDRVRPPRSTPMSGTFPATQRERLELSVSNRTAQRTRPSITRLFGSCGAVGRKNRGLALQIQRRRSSHVFTPCVRST